MEDRLERSLIEVLQGRALEWFRLITQKEVKGIRFERSEIRVELPDAARSASELSTGTRDPLYFAARLAMAEEVSKGDLFLLLDDPFLTCDTERTKRLIEIIHRVSERFQIFLATKDPWLKDLLAQENTHLIELSP